MSKGALKAIAELVRQSKWDEAIDQARGFVQKEPRNFQAHLLLAFALDKQQKNDDSEKSYLTAAALKPEDPQPWQGLIKLYQKQGGAKLDAYKKAALELAEHYRGANDMFKCQSVIDAFTSYAKAQGEAHYVEALDIILPDSPIYPALEGRVPHPAKTYETIAKFVETDEKKRINILIGERRTRIGARVNEVTIDVKREVLGQSRLGHIYRQLINWTNDDDLRRVYEEKLLQHCHDRLVVFPPGDDKLRELQVVQKLAGDMVIIKHPFKLAWDITIDWQDNKEIREWDVTVLREYCSFFPDSDVYKIVTGFLTCSISPFPKADQTKKSSAQPADEPSDDESEDDEDGGAPTAFVPITDEDRILMMTEGIVGANSLLAYRLMGEYYQHLEEYDSNVDLMRKAREHLNAERRKTGLKFQNTENALLVCLGTALVFYQSPRNHQEAKSLFDSVLERDPTATPALIGVGLIYEEEEEFDEAIAFFERALKRDPTNLRVRTEAGWIKARKGNYATCKEELEECIPEIEEAGQSSKGLLAQTQYRLGVCIWNMDTSKAARKSRSGAYSQFLACLKNDLNYAPAYTSLGIYYEDCSKDKMRARKCFVKAIELSPSEVDAAERLARSFADDRDWDSVEFVAQRVVDSGKVKPPPGSKRKGLSWPFSALGVAELNKQDYAKAVVSFQSALRVKPDDYHSWVGLAESYYNSGRYIAATKATLNAQQLESTCAGPKDPSDTWFTKFLLANVKRLLSQFDEAIDLYKEVIEARPGEDGVSIALMQTMIEGALSCLDKGLFGKAVGLAIDTLTFATTAASTISETFNFWKAVADSCSIFSSVQGRLDDFPAEIVRTLIGNDDTRPEYDTLKDVDGVGIRVIQAEGLSSEDEKVGVDLTQCLQAAILAHKRAIFASARDVHAQAVAYFNLGWAEYRAHSSLPTTLRNKTSRYLKAAVRAFKRAIELEAGNSEFWEALGVATSSINPSVAQHAFVRSLYLNERSPSAWANVGALALLYNDLQLANEAFARSQSADPDYAHAWVGQGFVALLYGDAGEARGLFTHAMGISGSASSITRQQYAASMFDHIVSLPPDQSTPISSILQPVFALSQLRALKPKHELAVGHLLTLFHERVGHHSETVAVLEPVCATLEADYENTESAESLKRFALAKTDLARAYLATGAYEKAIECGEMALQLSSTGEDGEESELTAEERNRARLSAHLTVGLAQYYSNAVDEAVQYFQAALEESGSDADSVCVLAQVLWATGAEEARDRVRASLFDVVERRPDHVRSVLLLGAIALLDEDEESLEAVTSELQGLRASEKVGATEQSQISEILGAVAALSADAENKIREQAQVDIMLHPHLPHGWLNLSLAEDAGAAGYAAEMAVGLARRAVAPRGNLGAEDLAQTYAGTARAADAQTAIVVAPWAKDGWFGLAECLAAR